ncbi:MAG: M48 family metalloprotease [Acidimicrobiia bacterium]|nr:M48 family metalloprotease [Acidimicrobiia bacterium]
MTTTDFRSLQTKNRRITWFLLTASFALLAIVGIAAAFSLGLGLVGGVVFAVAALALTSAAYFGSDSIALLATRASEADPSEYRRLHNLVEGLSLASGLPKPRVFVVDDPAPNAFATGRSPDRAAVAVTTGLLDKMERVELEGVLAHELAHVRNYDIRVMTVAVATAGAVALIADLFWRALWWGGVNGGRRRDSRDNGGANVIVLIGFVVVVILAPIAALLLRAAISRSREGLADASAVEITRNPSGLRRALEKLESDVTVVRHTSHATSHLWIESPDDHEKGHKGSRLNNLFTTHPPLRDRIDALRAMEGLGPAAAAASATTQASVPASSFTTMGASLAAAAEAGESGAAAVPQGWYPDPLDATRQRWWTGSAWTTNITTG